jgi:antitoxin MazE
MITTIQKWGNSQGLRLSKTLLSDVEIAVGDAVDVAVHKGALIVTPVRRVRGGHDLLCGASRRATDRKNWAGAPPSAARCGDGGLCPAEGRADRAHV